MATQFLVKPGIGTFHKGLLTWRDMLQGQIPWQTLCDILQCEFVKNSDYLNKYIELTVKMRKWFIQILPLATCCMSWSHSATTSVLYVKFCPGCDMLHKIKPISFHGTYRVDKKLSLQHVFYMEHMMKFVSAACPCNLSLHVNEP
jgi:hypothetical protein